jgi:hypothetical protein
MTTIDFDAIDVTLTGFSMPEIEELGSLLHSDSNNGGFGDIDPDAVLSAEARKFSFQVGSDEQANICREALRCFGMTGPKNGGAAFAAAMRAALEAHQSEEPPPSQG